MSREGLWVQADEAPAWRELLARLIWHHGYDRAREIVQGKDPDTEADRHDWRNLGRGRR